MVRRLALAAALLVAAGHLDAATFVVRSDENLIQTADAIVVGHVLGTRPGDREIVTRIAVDRRLKSAVPPVVTLVEPDIAGAPRFEEGTRVLLFLMKTGQDRWATLDFVIGKFEFAYDTAGQELVVREESELTGWDPQGMTEHVEPRRSAAAFIDYIEKRGRGIPARVEYQVERHPLIRRQAFSPATEGQSEPFSGTVEANAINFPPSTYMMSCGPNGCRWNVFPNAVNWYNQNTLSGAPENGIAAIRTAFNSWNGHCESNINYQYVGSRSSATGGLQSPDGTNAVVFERSLSSYGAPPYSCSSGGTIAIGGVSSAGGSHVHRNETFATTIEGDVMVNQGLASCPSFTNSERFLTAMTHEFGHTLGIRHSNQNRTSNGPCPSGYDCSSSAVMNSSILSGLNAQLQQWDRNAAEAVYTGSCTVTPPPPPPPTTPVKVRYDHNGDGRADIFWRNTSTGQNWMYMMNGTSIQSSVHVNYENDQRWQPAGIGDFNGDGKADIYWRNDVSGYNYVYLMNGNVIIGEGLSRPETNLQWEVAGVGDLNGDGKEDIVWRNQQTGANYVYFMNGIAVASAAAINTQANLSWTIAGVADFNADGKADILWRNVSTGANWLYLMNGNDIVSEGSVQSRDLGWRIMGVADFNADRKADILWRHNATGQNWMFLMNGRSVVSSVNVNTEPDLSWQVANVADYSGDGRADILWRNNVTGENWMYLMSGNLITASRPVNREGNLNWRIVR